MDFMLTGLHISAAHPLGFSLPTAGQAEAIGLAFLLCLLIGLERELRHKDAGIRTHVLVGLAACLFTQASVWGANLVHFSTGTEWDAARIAAQVVSGIGFLGAGVIWLNHDAIRGLTTASAIWLAAAVGLACGLEMFTLAILVTIAYFFLILVVSPLFYRITNRFGRTIRISYVQGHGVLSQVMIQISSKGFEARVLSATTTEISGERRAQVTVSLKGSMTARQFQSIVQDLTEMKGVEEVTLAESDEN